MPGFTAEAGLLDQDGSGISRFDPGLSPGAYPMGLSSWVWPNWLRYGNWCGPFYGGGKSVDQVDACCREHDLCYSREGWGDCDCDRVLVRCVTPHTRGWTRKAWAASAIRRVFQAKTGTLCRLVDASTPGGSGNWSEQPR